MKMLSSQDLMSGLATCLMADQPAQGVGQVGVLQGAGSPVVHVVGAPVMHAVGGGHGATNALVFAGSGHHAVSLGMPVGVVPQPPLTLFQVILPSQCQQIVVPPAPIPLAQAVLPPQEGTHSSTELLDGGSSGSQQKDCFLDDRTISQMDAITRASDGIDLDEIRDLVRAFKEKRVGLGLTQTQVGQDLEATTGVAYSQSAVCRIERLDITPRQAQALRPVLSKWLSCADERYCYLNQSGTLVPILFNRFVMGNAAVAAAAGGSKKRQKRTTFAPETLRALHAEFEKNPQPNAWRMGQMAKELSVEYKTVRVWFCNKRQLMRNSLTESKECGSLRSLEQEATATALSSVCADDDADADISDSLADLDDSTGFDSAAFEMAMQLADMDAQSW